jgi:hypothetical protein
MRGTVTWVEYRGKSYFDNVQFWVRDMYEKGWRLVGVVHPEGTNEILLFWEEREAN